MNLRSLSLIVLCHGIVAAVFAFVFLLEAFEIALPLISLEAQHPNFIATEYSKAACLFVAVGIGTFAAYEIFFFPSYLNSADDISKKNKDDICLIPYPMVANDNLYCFARWSHLECMDLRCSNVWLYIMGRNSKVLIGLR